MPDFTPEQIAFIEEMIAKAIARERAAVVRAAYVNGGVLRPLPDPDAEAD